MKVEKQPLNMDEKLQDTLGKLYERYSADGQDLNSQLEGLYHSKYVNYWEYIRLDTILTLQNTRTDLPDEMIFIVYHQITELYFKMVLHELQQLQKAEQVTAELFTKRLKRLNSVLRLLRQVVFSRYNTEW